MVSGRDFSINKLLPSMLAIVYLSITLIFGLFLHFNLGSRIIEGNTASAKQLISLLQREMLSDLFHGRTQDAQSALASRATNHQVNRLFAVDPNGVVFSSINEEDFGSYPEQVSEMYHTVLLGDQYHNHVPIIQYRKQDEMIVASYPLKSLNHAFNPSVEEIGVLYLEYDVSRDLAQLWSALVQYVVVFGGILFVLMLILNRLLVHLIVHPLGRLADAAVVIAEGREITIELPNNGAAEVTRLSAAMGAMQLKLNANARRKNLEVKKIKALAEHDALTGLMNRRATRAGLKTIVETAAMNVTSVAVMFIDLDNFKQVNDTLGHHYGDTCLQTVADALNGVTRNIDLLGRIGGDEFLLICPGIASERQVQELAERMIACLEDCLPVEAQELGLSASIGIAIYPDHGYQVGDLIAHADIAMYAAKRSGKRQFEFYNESLVDVGT